MSDIINILYVDDSYGDVELLSMSLERYNFSHLVLDVAETIKEAKEVFTQGKHAAALIDWNLPDGKGTEIAQYLHTIDKTLPIVFLSSLLTEEHIKEAQQYQPKACLEKDFSEDFIVKINDLVC